MEYRFTKTWWFCCFAALLTACAGCWQEVHYDPSASQAVSPVLSDHTEDSAGTTKSEPPLEPPARADDQPEADEVTADELFSAAEDGSGPPPAPEASTAPDLEPEQPVPTDEESPIAATVPDAADEASTVTENSEPVVESIVAPAEPPDSDATADSTTVELMRPSRTALAVWRMSSRWSMAAAIYAKGQPEERYRDSLDQATYAADLVGVKLPALPTSEGAALETAVISYLLDSGAAAFVNKLNEDYVPEYEALAELAVRTNTLLLVYTPKSQQLDPLISSIRQSAEASGLPAELWTELVSMLERREPFADVKQRVLLFHTEVGNYLAGEE